MLLAAKDANEDVSVGEELRLAGDKREIGKLAVWSVSTAKPGNGVELLRDGNVKTFWQSDGAQPHLVNIQFQKKMRLQQVSLYTDIKLDESYTPQRISIRAGNSFHDLRELKVMEISEPNGWVNISLQDRDSEEDLRAYFVQLAVLSNHQNGRDTHIRQITIYGPKQSEGRVTSLPAFSTLEFSMYSTIR